MKRIFDSPIAFHEPGRGLQSAGTWDRPTRLEFWTALDYPTLLRTEVRAPRPAHGPEARPKLEVEASHEPRFVEAGFQPAGEGGILPPGWEAGLTGSQGWLPPRFMAGVQVRMEQGAAHEPRWFPRAGFPPTPSHIPSGREGIPRTGEWVVQGFNARIGSGGALLLTLVISLLAGRGQSAELVDDRVITIRSAREVTEKRRVLMQYLWGDAGFPARRMPDAVLTKVPSPVRQLTNLARVDEFRIEMAPGLQGLAYHFIPQRPNRELVVVHHGHGCTLDDDSGPADVGFGLQRTICALLREGYGALGVFMPHMRPGDCTGKHDAMFQMTNVTGSPIKFFLEPTAISLNYLKARSRAGRFPNYRAFHMIGLSGGGWTTTVYAAIDPSIQYSFPVAGTMPLYLRSGGSVGDREQFEPSFYRLAGYPDLYILGAQGRGRKQVQILLRRDDCCFGQAQHDEKATGLPYAEALRAYEREVTPALSQIGRGSFRLEIDETAPSHMISHHAIEQIILPELRGAR